MGCVINMRQWLADRAAHQQQALVHRENLRDIGTYLCMQCNHTWVGPLNVPDLHCPGPGCGSRALMMSDPRRENAPRIK